MRRIASHVIVASLTFCVGLSLNHLSFRSRQSLPVAVARPEGVSAGLIKFERKYQPGGSVNGLTNDGYRFCRVGLAASDGMTFTQMSIYYNSHARAERELQRALRETTEIIEREPFRGDHGQALGEKVIATFFVTSDYGPAAMLWTDGSTFRYLQGSSLPNILTYEKDN